jgi:shikimate dehydrogenase
VDLKSLFQDVPAGRAWYGVVGSGIPYTLSPALHNAAIARYGLKAAYRKIDIPESEWASFLSQKDLLSGFNITNPFKEKAREIGSGPSGVEWGFVGAVNTAHRQALWVVENTDVEGFRSDAESQGIQFGNKNVLILGAGGAARAALGAFLWPHRPGPKTVTVCNRNPARAEELVREFSSARSGVPPPRVRAARLENDSVFREADVIINATRAGQTPGDPPPLDPARLRPGQAVYDMVYHRETELLKAARAQGCLAVGGLGMLVNQGALAFERWFGEELKKLKYDALELRRVMREAAQNAKKETL